MFKKLIVCCFALVTLLSYQVLACDNFQTCSCSRAIGDYATQIEYATCTGNCSQPAGPSLVTAYNSRTGATIVT